MAQHSDDEVDQLLRAAMQLAPAFMHHVFSLEGKSCGRFRSRTSLTKSSGANEVLLGLNTVESKVAYLIQIIAIELYKASKAISPRVRFHSTHLPQALLTCTAEYLLWSQRPSIPHPAGRSFVCFLPLQHHNARPRRTRGFVLRRLRKAQGITPRSRHSLDERLQRSSRHILCLS